MAEITYVELTDEAYDKLICNEANNRHARYIGVEEFRLWCAGNKGTETVEDGLRACTVDELSEALTRECMVSGWFDHLYLVRELCRRLNARQAEAERRRAEAAQTPEVVF